MLLTQGQWWGNSPRHIFRWTTLKALEQPAPWSPLKKMPRNIWDYRWAPHITFNIQGVPFDATVSSLRTVDWGSFSLNFFMIMEPGSLDGAPITYIATAKVPETVEIPLQQAIVSSYAECDSHSCW